MDDVHVILACDRAFRMQAAVTIASICRHFDFQKRGLHLNVFHSGLRGSDKAKISRSTGTQPVTLSWHEVDPSPLRGARTHGHVSLASYFRILAFQHLSTSLDKVLYLDCDTLVQADLNELWNGHPAPGRILAAAQDPGVPFVDAAAALGADHPCLNLLNSTVALPDHARLGVPRDAPYFNAGVMLVDLAAWKSRGLTEALLDFIRREWRQLTMWDQDALNALLWPDWQTLPPAWNVMPPHFRHRPGSSPFAGADLVAATTRPAIIHYADRSKPWHFGYAGPFASEWFDDLDQTAWRGWRPGRMNQWLRGLLAPWRYVRDGIRWHLRRLFERAG